MFRKFLLSSLSILAALSLMGPYHAPNSNNTVQTTQTSNEKPKVAITEIFLGDEPRLAITNLEDKTVQLNGWFLCNRPGYFQLPNMSLSPGQRVVVHLGTSGTNTATDIYTGSRLSTPSATADEMALYLNGRFGSEDSIVDYVQWGRAGQSPSREGVAIRADLWGQNQFVDVSSLTDTDSLYFDGTGGDQVSDYFIALSVLAQGSSDEVVLVHSLSDLTISPATIDLQAGQTVKLMNVAKDGGHNPVELLDSNGNVVFGVSFDLQTDSVVDVEFTPTAGIYTLSHQAHGHPIESEIVVR